MVAGPCATQIPLPAIPAHVSVRPAPPSGRPPFLRAGDAIVVTPPGTLTFGYDGNVYRVQHGRLSLGCTSVLLPATGATGAAGAAGAADAAGATGLTRTRVLAVKLASGRVSVRSSANGAQARAALVLTPEMLAYTALPGRRFEVNRDPHAKRTRASPESANAEIVAAKASDQALRINTRSTYTAIADAAGLRLDVWPFPVSPLQRPTTPADALPAFWDDGKPCSVGCTPPGVTPGWPLKPFHQQHAIRAGINELRPANFHVAVDIEANNFQPVYALQSGVATIRYPGTGDVNVDVGDFYYWHIHPLVKNGERVTAYKTELGTVLGGFYHVALSQLGPSGGYLNPLRPGGSLLPYTNAEAPIIGVPKIYPDGRVIVGAFGPQSFVVKGPYETPVLAPSSLAWRLYDAAGNALTPLEWAMRGSQNYPPQLRATIFAPGASNPGFGCFFTRRICIPNWVYWLAGGLTEPLPVATLPSGRYRLAVYAWDWAGNTSALDYSFTLPLAGLANSPEFGPLAPIWDYP